MQRTSDQASDAKRWGAGALVFATLAAAAPFSPAGEVQDLGEDLGEEVRRGGGRRGGARRGSGGGGGLLGTCTACMVVLLVVAALTGVFVFVPAYGGRWEPSGTGGWTLRWDSDGPARGGGRRRGPQRLVSSPPPSTASRRRPSSGASTLHTDDEAAYMPPYRSTREEL